MIWRETSVHKCYFLGCHQVGENLSEMSYTFACFLKQWCAYNTVFNYWKECYDLLLSVPAERTKKKRLTEFILEPVHRNHTDYLLDLSYSFWFKCMQPLERNTLTLSQLLQDSSTATYTHKDTCKRFTQRKRALLIRIEQSCKLKPLEEAGR
jgi:hypothetical protein